MIELVATTRIPRQISVAYMDMGGSTFSGYRKSILLALAREMAEKILDQMTVRQIREVGTGEIIIEARLLVGDRRELVGSPMPSSISGNSIIDDADKLNEIIAADIRRAKEELLLGGRDASFSANAFLQARAEGKSARDEAKLSAKESVGAKRAAREQIRTNTKQRGPAPLIEIAVRKISMPEDVSE